MLLKSLSMKILCASLFLHSNAQGLRISSNIRSIKLFTNNGDGMNVITQNELSPFLQRFESRKAAISRQVEQVVADILSQIRLRGDNALAEFSQRYDHVDLSRIPLLVPEEKLHQAHSHLDPNLLDVLRQAATNIRDFHSKMQPQSWLSWESDGVVLGQRVTALDRVGVYVPGGRAAYPSSFLMGVIPAQVAGVSEIIVATPCDSQGEMNATILAAAYELGISRVFRMGGAQAIAAMAFGTQTVPRVDKIVGPGNIYVAIAKKMLYGQCGIDMVAGPSEVLIIADQSASAEFVAADLLAQAEHDPLASAILLTDSSDLVHQVVRQIDLQKKMLPRIEIIQQSLDNYGAIICCDSLEQCAMISDRLAPEHLGLHVEKPWEMLGLIKNAGAIFLGHYSPEAVGDYWAGPNHVL
ncbi:MAG: histidinol dehydrogenase, partial [Calditrichaeota bacterium]